MTSRRDAAATEPRELLHRVARRLWNDPRFLVRFWTAFVPLAAVALLVWWLS